MHEFDAGYRNRRVSNTFEPQHRTQPKLDRSMRLRVRGKTAPEIWTAVRIRGHRLNWNERMGTGQNLGRLV